MLLDNYDYNMSYAHRSFAFEHALLDAMIRLSNGDSKKVLAGGIDEITPNQFNLYDRLNWWRKEPFSNLEMIRKPSQGTISGEGFTFFILQGEKSNKTYAMVEEVHTKISNNIAADSQVIKILRARKIDWVFAGFNGDYKTDKVYMDVIPKLYPGGSNVAAWKHLCGEYLTSSAFAMGLAARAIRENKVPEIMKLEESKKPGKIRNILIYNHFKGTHHSFILLSAPANQ